MLKSIIHQLRVDVEMLYPKVDFLKDINTASDFLISLVLLM